MKQAWKSEPELKSHIRSSCFTDLLMLMETAVEAHCWSFTRFPK